MRASQACERMETALRGGQWSEVIRLGCKVLSVVPHHLWAEALLGQAYLAEGRTADASACFQAVIERDPECTAARVGLGLHRGSWNGAGASGKSIHPMSQQPLPSQPQGDELSHPASLASDHCQRAELLWRLGSLPEAAEEASIALRMASHSVKATLLLADIAWRSTDQDRFAEWFHQAQRLDPSGVVASRTWGADHPLLGMVTVDPDVPGESLESPNAEPKTPAGGSSPTEPVVSSGRRGVAQPRDVDWLLEHSDSQPMGTADPPSDGANGQRDDDLAQIERELNRIASSLGVQSVASTESRHRARPLSEHRAGRVWQGPLHLIVTNRAPLEAKYGPVGALRVNRALNQLADAISAEQPGQALVLYLDDARALHPYGLAPADPTNPEELKSVLDRVQDNLWDAGTGQTVLDPVTVLIVGGDDIVPFHRLPDSNEDEDGPVLSDHPYACSGNADTDSHYLSCDRIVGRLPDGLSRDVEPLLQVITAATNAHHLTAERKSVWETLGGWMGRSNSRADVTSFGYSASIWRRAAREVFRSIGQPRHLRTSPPLTCEEVPALGPIAPRFSYFNLHGLRDSAYWYGQRDPTYAAGYPLYPVAIQPDNIPVVARPRSVVFSEACYGAYILGKDQTSSLALRFLAAQALGVVASTSLAYGALDVPLMGADLLARSFWEGVKAGHSLGRALREAKEALIQEMLSRQGYLDPEDEKTILSFVLLGDPTLVLESAVEDQAHEPEDREYSPAAALQMAAVGYDVYATAGSAWDKAVGPAVCRRRAIQTELVAPELLVRVQDRLASYVPASMWGDVAVSTQTACDGVQCGKNCDQCQDLALGALRKGQASATEDAGCASARPALVLTLQQKSPLNMGDHGEVRIHQQIAKVTLDRQGNLVKVAMSR